MKNIGIGKIIVSKRKEKGITQEELAEFMGVSRASVSKWEKGYSYPDITFLPQLASYFDISLDELMDYEPELTDDEIRKLYAELLKEFAAEPFDEVLEHCRAIIKKYYSCYPLLFQIGILFMNYSAAVSEAEKKTSTITEAKKIFTRVKTLSDDVELKQLALQSEAVCEMMLDNPNEVVALLEHERRYSFQPSIEVLLSQSYQMLGKSREAKITLQDSILNNIISLFYDMNSYLAICADDADHFEEICIRIMSISDAFNIKKLFPAAILPIYVTAAEGYSAIENTEKTLAMLEAYTEIATDDIFPLTVRGDDFFTFVNEIQEKQKRKNPLGMQTLPRDEQSIKQDMVDAVIKNPAFSALHTEQRFQNLASRLEQIL